MCDFACAPMWTQLAVGASPPGAPADPGRRRRDPNNSHRNVAVSVISSASPTVVIRITVSPTCVIRSEDEDESNASRTNTVIATVHARDKGESPGEPSRAISPTHTTAHGQPAPRSCGRDVIGSTDRGARRISHRALRADHASAADVVVVGPTPGLVFASDSGT